MFETLTQHKLSEMKVGILFPNTETSRSLGARLLENSYDLAFLCPGKFDLDYAQNIIFELNMISQEMNSQRETQKSFSVENSDMSDCDVLGEIKNAVISIFIIQQFQLSHGLM